MPKPNDGAVDETDDPILKSVVRAIGAKKLKVKDSVARVMTALGRIAPRRKEGDEMGLDVPTFEFSRTSESVMSEVKYVLFIDNKPFDIATGGLPFGRLVEIFGLEDSGKTALVKRAGLKAFLKNIYQRVVTSDERGVKKVSYERLDPNTYDVVVAYIDNEQSFDDDNSLVVEGKNVDFILGRIDTINQVFKACEQTVHEMKEIEKETGRPQFVVFILDSLASTSSEQEMDQEWGTEDYSRMPKQLRQGFRKLVRYINRFNVLFIVTNQVSDSFVKQKQKNPNAMPDDSAFSSSGGRACKYYASQRIFVQRTPYKFKMVKGGEEDGFVTEILTAKNRLKKPRRKARLTLLFGGLDREGGGYSDSFSILETLMMYDLVTYADDRWSFRFEACGITTTTFAKKQRGNPYIESRQEWPAFYQEHKADVDLLMEECQKLMFSSGDSSGLLDQPLEVEDARLEEKAEDRIFS